MNKTSVAYFALVLTISGCQVEHDPENIVFFLVDDLGWMDVGYNNPDTFYETPNIDWLASRSLVFNSAYSTSSVSSPTRASIMTGKYPARVGMTDFTGARTPEKVLTRRNYPHPLLPAVFENKIRLQETTIAEALKKAGYGTFFAGKWAIGPPGFWPEDQGFDINKGGWTIGAPQTGNKYFSPYDNPRLTDGVDGEHLPDRLATETIAFISGHLKTPFFALLSFYSVHTPLMTRTDLQNKYEKKAENAPVDSFGTEGTRRVRLTQNHPIYAGMVESVDQAIGRVVKALDDLSIADDTIIIFYSDNGGLSTSEGHPTSNIPLRGGKGWLYEGGIRVPMFILVPGSTDEGQISDQAVTSTDLFPTILDLVGVDLLPAQHRDGLSLKPVFAGHQLAARNLYWHYPHYSHQGGSPASAILSGHLKYIEYYENRPPELFNLSEDIGETTNLIEKSSGTAHRMQVDLDAWLLDMKARYPTRNPNRIESKTITHKKVVAYQKAIVPTTQSR